jgi:hypothetical protein
MRARVTQHNVDANRGGVPRCLPRDVLYRQHAIAEYDLSLTIGYFDWWSPGSTTDWLRDHLSTAARCGARGPCRTAGSEREEAEDGERRPECAAGSDQGEVAW